MHFNFSLKILLERAQLIRKSPQEVGLSHQNLGLQKLGHLRARSDPEGARDPESRPLLPKLNNELKSSALGTENVLCISTVMF